VLGYVFLSCYIFKIYSILILAWPAQIAGGHVPKLATYLSIALNYALITLML